MFQQLISGVEYCHQHAVVHRDLKPANVLLNSEGVVKLTDFGVSKQLESTQAVAMTQVGSTAYMSPERLKGDEYSYASDVWSVGIVALEAFRGEHPFPPSKYKSFLNLFQAICNSKPPAPPDSTPPAAVDFVSQCLQVAPASRPSVATLLDGAWLQPLSKAGARQVVFRWLMTAATALTGFWPARSPAPATASAISATAS